MRAPEFTLALGLAACSPAIPKIGDPVRELDELTDDSGTGHTDDTSVPTEGCHLSAYSYEYPMPPIEHADVNPLTDVRNSLLTIVSNIGTKDCPESELSLFKDEVLLNQWELPGLPSGENTVLVQTDVIYDSPSTVEFHVESEGENIGSLSSTPRQVGSVLRGQFAEYLVNEFGVETSPCNGELEFLGVPDHSAYCPEMKVAIDRVWYGQGGEYDSLTSAMLASSLIRSFPSEFGTDIEGMCPGLEEDWYTADMKVVARRFPEITSLCTPDANVLIHDLYGTYHPSGGILDQLTP